MDQTANMSAAGSGSGIRARLRVVLHGVVQGVGFRPFVHRLATAAGLCGWVRNGADAVTVEVEGEASRLQQFAADMENRRPAGSFIASAEALWLDPVGLQGFAILPTDTAAPTGAWVRPDVGTCPDCLREVLDPADRRHGYPFTNCTRCGPRFTILERVPYDRPNTSMRRFKMCPRCQAEYDDAGDRRFHAQPNACPECGPHLEFWGPQGERLAERGAALARAVEGLRSGRIIAVKGLGGFHLMVRASDAAAVLRLRERKRREAKPFALMFPDAVAVRRVCAVSPAEQRLLEAPEVPIVLLDRLAASVGPEVASEVAPGLASLGIMLPATPLHHLLLRELGEPVVATSGNVSDEPLCTDETEAVERLAGLADAFLVHDRPIVRHADDSLARVVCDREMVLRRARGYAPLPVSLGEGQDGPAILGVGAHLKNSVAVASGSRVFISQHIGDLETVEAHAAFRRSVQELASLHRVEPVVVAADLHPDYLSSRYARESGLPVEWVQHHFAHVAAAMAENELQGTVLGVAWDGTGLGQDGTVWGGEFLRASREDFVRAAHLRCFRLAGGEVAAREPRRAALGLLHAWNGKAGVEEAPRSWQQQFNAEELGTLLTMLERRVNSPVTSSMGRLFDAVASLAGVQPIARFEGQAAMRLEALLPAAAAAEPAYPWQLGPKATPGLSAARVVDWEPMLSALLADVTSGVDAGRTAARFHNGLVEATVQVAQWVGEERVVLSGGCFQNRYLLERAVQRLRAEGFRPYWPQRVPPNDGGIALGQVVVARARWVRDRRGERTGP